MEYNMWAPTRSSNWFSYQDQISCKVNKILTSGHEVIIVCLLLISEGWRQGSETTYFTLSPANLVLENVKLFCSFFFFTLTISQGASSVISWGFWFLFYLDLDCRLKHFKIFHYSHVTTSLSKINSFIFLLSVDIILNNFPTILFDKDY